VFGKVLVANRGEIAVRVIRACHELGVAAVAVYAEGDEHAMHVRLADEAHPLGGRRAADSYLNIPAILAAVAASGAEAVHPGYGFLSENAEFAERVEATGTVFIGPPPAAIAAMGSKISARRVAEAAGVACVPGRSVPVTGPAEVEAFAGEYGYPVAIKAAFGGGGRGMRVVGAPGGAAEALAAARREALAAFGADEVYLERYLDRPRHIEMQILADAAGTVLWLGERDCSVQRRHQKLIEESPAPGFDEPARAAMGAAAIAVARAVGYVNAGTVEFLVQDGEFYFLEMNTRLQVEHPVTEAVTGLDLVAAQLRIAAGEPLWLGQADIHRTGHAMEFRINAEDPAGGRFLPSPGRIEELSVPAGAGIRFDAGYESGDEVSDRYDNLIGKLVISGPDRPAVLALARQALAAVRVTGVASTVPAHLAVLGAAPFVQGRHSTRWLESTAQLLAGPAGGVDPRRVVVVNGRRYWIPVFADGPRLDSEPAATAPPEALAAMFAAAVVPPSAAAAGDGVVRAPMQGTVAATPVAEGDRVRADQVVCVVEAMKMENPMPAGRDGVVVKVPVTVGQPVAAGEVLAVIE
jgi:acetyl-CoA/propionyl-CoA carboxylase biotin carboxyl carrier protein